MIKLGQILLTSGGDDHVSLVSDIFSNMQARIVDAQDLLTNSFDDGTWIFVDWLLPVMAGIQLVRLLRQSATTRGARISMVLPSQDMAMQARALDAGADDYVVGPLTPAALVDRMRTYRAALRKPDEVVLRLGDLTVDTNAYSARMDGRPIPLRTGEFQLLAHFAANPNRVFTRGNLIGVLGKTGSVHEERTVDVWMSRLRATLKKHGVKTIPRTVRAYGYILDFDEVADAGIGASIGASIGAGIAAGGDGGVEAEASGLADNAA